MKAFFSAEQYEKSYHLKLKYSSFLDNDAHGNSAFHPDANSGGIVHTGEGGFELQTSLLSDKGMIQPFYVLIYPSFDLLKYLKFSK